MALPIFKDLQLQQEFEKNGFVKIPLLTPDEVKCLLDYYYSLDHSQVNKTGFHISLDHTDENYINGIFDKLFSVIHPKLDHWLTNYQTFTASYTVKEPGLQNIVPPHQDWSFVDETLHCSATVWTPLMDVNKSNGALGLIKGSHRFFSIPRSSPSPQSRSILTDFVFTIFPYVQLVELAAGEALIFDNRTIHASPPNTSTTPRIAAGIGVTNNTAQLLHYYQLPDQPDTLEVYHVEPSFFRVYTNSRLSSLYNEGKSPENLKKLTTFKKPYISITEGELKKMVEDVDGNTFNHELVNELAELYHYNPATGKKIVEQSIEEPTPKKNFFQIYTPSNILAEIKYRLSKSPKTKV